MSVVNCQSISVGPGLRRRSAPRNAFTLVELLIVTSIVVILIGVLIPTLNRSIRAAKATVCMNWIAPRSWCSSIGCAPCSAHQIAPKVAAASAKAPQAQTVRHDARATR